MRAFERNLPRRVRGMGLIEVMVGIVISMLLVLVIYQIYEVSEGQKRTVTAGSDAQQNASYGLHVLARDIAVAGHGIASAASQLAQCAQLRPIPVLITAGADDNTPDGVTVVYGGSSSLATAVQFNQPATTADRYRVPGPVGFSPDDVIVAVEGATCTISTIRSDPSSVAVDAAGFASIDHAPVPGSAAAGYNADTASLINLGRKESMGRIAYTVDLSSSALRTQRQLPTVEPVTPVVGDVVNLKAQYGLDTDNDGSVDAWQPADTGVWTAALLPTQPLATLQRIRAVRVAIVTRSPQYEKDVVTPGPLKLFGDSLEMTLSDADQHYRYRVLESVVPLRNALWNAPSP